MILILLIIAAGIYSFFTIPVDAFYVFGIGEAVKIRQSPMIDSFNLPISVSVACYEFARQKKLFGK